MAAEVDVYGIENIIKRFDLGKCDDFAVFTGQGDKWRLKFPGSTRELFEENVRSIDPGSDATYQVRFYKKNFDEEDITPATVYNSSFNFKVREKQNGVGPSGNNWQGLSMGDMRYMNFIERELERYKEKCEELEDENADLQTIVDDYEDKGNKKLGAVGTIVPMFEQNPQFMEAFKPLINAVAGMLNKAQGNAPAVKTDLPPITADVGDPVARERTMQQAVAKLMAFYTQNYGEQGDAILTQDMATLANLTGDPELFMVAIKRLRNNA